MFSGKKPRGFTIVETMIFLAVSGILFLSTIEIVDGQQNKTQFFQAIHVTFSNLQTVSNDVADGYYNGNSNFTCVASGVVNQQPTVLNITQTKQGQNLGCIYIGEYLQFAPNNNVNQIAVYSMLGNQFNGPVGTSPPVTNLTEAAPVPLAVNKTLTNYYRTMYLPGGVSVGSVSYTDPSTGGINSPQYVGYVGFLSSFSQTATGSSLLQSGSQNVDIVPLASAPLNAKSTYLVNGYNGVPDSKVFNDLSSITEGTYNGATAAFNGNVANSVNSPGIIDPQKGVSICFNSTSTNQSGIVKIGINNNPVGMQLTIANGKCQ